jgi:hypothetical protein
MAGVPDPTASTVPTNIWLGPLRNSVDVKVEKTMTIRDAFSNPVGNSTVVIDFSACASNLGPNPPNDHRLYTPQDHHPGALFNCAQHTVTAVTNASGVATFRIGGSARNISGPSAPGYSNAAVGCGVITADGVPFGRIKVAVFDQDGGGGCNSGDLSRFFVDSFAFLQGGASAYRARSDYNSDGLVNPADLSIFFNMLSQPPGTGSGAPCNL